MPRTFLLVLLLLVILLGAAIAGCKTSKPAAKKSDEAKPVETAAPGDQPRLPDPAPRDPPGRDDPATGSNTELQDKGLAMMTRMSDVFAANAGDCDKLAAEIKKMIETNKDLLGQLQADDLKQTGVQRTAFEARNKAVMDTAIAKMAPVAKACRENETFMAVMRDAPSL
jgi:hypothetical protein